MQDNTLIIVFSDHNESGLILTKKYKFKNIIILELDKNKEKSCNNLKKIYEENSKSKV